MTDEEPGTLGHDLLAWGPSGVPQTRRVLFGGGPRSFFRGAIVRRVQWSAGTEHLDETHGFVVGQRARKQCGERLGTKAGDLGVLVGRERPRAVLIQGAFHPS